MAAYCWLNGERVEAEQLTEDTAASAGVLGRKGRWLVVYADGFRQVVTDWDFRRDFTQVYPRAADRQPEPCDSGGKAA